MLLAVGIPRLKAANPIELAGVSDQRQPLSSRPLRNRPWEYLFFVDFEGHVEEPGIVKVLDTLRKRSLFLRVMGSYPRKSG